MREECHSKLILLADKPLEFFYHYHEYNQTEVCGDKNPDRQPFQYPNKDTEPAFSVPSMGNFLEQPKHQPSRPNNNFILHVSGYIKNFTSLRYVSKMCHLEKFTRKKLVN